MSATPPDAAERPTRRLLFAASLALAYGALTALYLRPIWRVFGDRIAPNAGDPLFNLWVLRWGAHQLRSGLPDLWNANIFFPTSGTLTLSDHLLGLAAIQAVVEALTGNPILGYNLLLFSSFVLTGAATAYVARASGCSRFAAAVAGGLFAFCPFRFAQLNHLQILWMPALPLTLWTWDRLLAERTPRRALLFLACYLGMVSGGSYLAYMIHLPLLVLFLNRWRRYRSRLLERRSLPVLAATAALMVTLALPFFLPYLRLGRSLGLQRQPYEVVENAAILASYLSPTRNSLWFQPEWRPWWQPWWRALTTSLGPLKRGEDTLFPGAVTLVFAAIGLGVAVRPRPPGAPRWSPRRRAGLWALGALAAAVWIGGEALTLAASVRGSRLEVPAWAWTALLVVLVAAVAPAWRLRADASRAPAEAVVTEAESETWFRGLLLAGLACFAFSFAIVFIPALAVVPGLDGMRVPARFAAFVVFALALAAARGIDRAGVLVRRRARPLLAAALAAAAILELAPRPTRWVRLQRPERFPEIYHWLATEGDVRAILELPIRPNPREALYMYYSTAHWRPIANGFSGLRPASHQQLTAAMRNLPDEAALDLAQSFGISHLVVHFEDMPLRISAAERRLWESGVAARRLLEVRRDGRVRVYRLR